jgi:hypothetical protein
LPENAENLPFKPDIGNSKERNIKFSGYVAFVIILIIILYAIESMVASGMISSEAASDYIILDYDSPNFFSLYLSKYVHSQDNPFHMVNNIASFLVVSVIIGILYFFFYPKIGIMMPEYYLLAVYIQIITVVPFSISIISYIYRQIGVIDEVMRYSVGFSGVVWALTGFMLFLVSLFLLKALSPRLAGHGGDFVRIVSVCLPILFLVSLLVILPVFIIVTDIHTSRNMFAHLAGFAYGWLIPALTGSYFVSSCANCKIANLLYTFLIFSIPFVIAAFLVAL